MMGQALPNNLGAAYMYDFNGVDAYIGKPKVIPAMVVIITKPSVLLSH